MSALFKLSPPAAPFRVDEVHGWQKAMADLRGWPKAITVGGEVKKDWLGRAVGKTRPPLAPPRFAEELRSRRFTNGADFDVVCKLYEDTLRDGFGALERLVYNDCAWGDAEAAELAATLRVVAAPEVLELNLCDNYYEMTSLAALGAAISGGALASLQTLDLVGCRVLTSLPAELASLTSLQTLTLDGCYALIRMPDLSELQRLQFPCDCRKENK